MRDDLQALNQLSEIEPPELLDTLVLERAAAVLDGAPRAPMPVPRLETFAYAASVAVYTAQALNVAARMLARVVGSIGG